MRRFALLTVVLTAVLVLVLPFIGGGGPAIGSSVSTAYADETGLPVFASAPTANTALAAVGQAKQVPASAARLQAQADAIATVAYLKQDTEHLAQKPVPIPAPPVVASSGRGGAAGAAASTAQRRAIRAAAGQACPASPGGGGSAPGGSQSGIGGTTTSDIQSFSAQFNAVRAANCLDPIAPSHFRYDACMETRLYWMAEDPSTDPGNTWGHAGVRSLAPAADGTYYSDTTPSRGCDGNLAGGSGNSGATVAQKWWDSMDHRLALYRPSFTGSTANVCIYFAMTHGGIPNEPSSFTRAAARWAAC
jgi:hypothetical protein